MESIKKQFDKLEENIKKNKVKDILSEKWLLAIFSILFIILIVVILSYFLPHKDLFNVENTSLILTFVGILTTFVVVSNYLQVRDIKRDIEKQNLKQQQEFNIKIKNTEEEFKNKINKIKDSINFQKDSSNLNLFYVYYRQCEYSKAINRLINLLIDTKDESLFDKILDDVMPTIDGNKPILSKTDKFFINQRLDNLKVHNDLLDKLIKIINN